MSGGDGDPCWCSLCGVRVPDAAQMSKHQDGKKHLRLVASAAARVKHEKHSVFVRNFPPSTTEDELKMYFGQFGVVEKVVLDKSTGGPKYAIVEFADEQVVAAVLEGSSPLLLGERKLVIKSRVSKPAVVKSSSSAAAATAPGKASASSSKDTSVPDSPMKVVDSSTDIVLQKLNAVSSIADQFYCLVQEQAVTDEERKRREHIAQQVCCALKVHAYSADSDLDVQLYGSSVNGLGVRSSDLDMTIMKASCVPVKEKVAEVTMLDELDQARLSSAESSFASSADSSTVSCSGIGVRTASMGSSSEAELETVKAELQGIAAVLRHHVAGCARVLTIPKARRPIIRFYHNDLKCSCDLTVDNHLALENTRLLNRYCELDRRTAALVHAVRMWAVNHELSGGSTSLLSGYSLAILVIAFLQRCSPPVLPCLQLPPLHARQQGESQEPVVIDGWPCLVHDGHIPGVNFDSPDKLLHGFFSYYGAFNFSSNVVTISSLADVSVDEVVQLSSQRVAEFTTSGQPQLARLHVFRRSAMCIQDPFEVTHNINSHGGPGLVRNFVNFCRSAALLCQSNWLVTAPNDGGLDAAASSAAPVTRWGLSQIVAPPSSRGVRSLSVSVSRDQMRTLCCASRVSESPPLTKGLVLECLSDFLTTNFGFQTKCSDVPASGISDDGSDGVMEESDSSGEESRDYPGKLKRSSQSCATAKRMRTSSGGRSNASTLVASHYHAYCESRRNTWLHRRRWRRGQHRQGGNDNGVLGAASQSQNDLSDPVLLAFELHLFREEDCIDGDYLVAFHPAHAKYMSELLTFVAVFKKDLLHTLSSGTVP